MYICVIEKITIISYYVSYYSCYCFDMKVYQISRLTYQIHYIFLLHILP